MNRYLRCYAEISLEAIGHNIREVKKRLPEGVKLLGVVKANAYGHGAVPVASYLENQVDYFATATIEEAVELRENGISAPILILGYVSPYQYGDLVEYDITQTIDSYAQALALEKEAARQNRKAKAHLAVDTGMTRIGFQVTEHDADEAAKIADLPHIELEGMFTHFSCADQEDKTYCSMQMEKYDKMTALLAERGVTIPLRHICNSAGIMEFDDHRFEMVRSGIITYGIYPSEEVKKERLDLIPALSWKSHVIHVKEVGPGIGVSYGATYVTEKPMTRIATVSAGYADGYPRALSNQGCVLIHGKKAPIIGRICMDQMMVDVTDIPDVQVEDVVTLVGTDGDETITIEEIANPAARFDYEMLCDISSRVTRVYK
ncbi:alanine racemase [Fusicatenibacter saccharivorans]|uniref:alanine racemase n=1 Tax=Fusicatenibacter saccharivorans TaxID=1150298 RepID=UPI0015715E20|nr:alanine racemase [Fusicatenibacter saccharivorans]NSD79288.1 alanine racemase [Fusicatenibacter saccharivorans]